jgi:hypothetical protein
VNLVIDLSTIFSGAGLAAILYTARMLNQLDKTQALSAERTAAHQLKIVELETQITTCKAEVAAIRLQVATFIAAAGIEIQAGEPHQ